MMFASKISTNYKLFEKKLLTIQCFVLLAGFGVVFCNKNAIKLIIFA